MVSLMHRRREMMLLRAAAPTVIPISWSYTDGLPSMNGWTKAVAGTQNEMLKADWLELTASGSSSYTMFSPPERQYSQSEIVFSAEANNAQNIFRLSDGSKVLAVRFQYSNNYKGLYLLNASAIASMTKLATVGLSTLYTVKLRISGTVGSVYLNGDLLVDNVDLSTIVSSAVSSNRFGCSGTYATTCRLYSMSYS